MKAKGERGGGGSEGRELREGGEKKGDLYTAQARTDIFAHIDTRRHGHEGRLARGRHS